MTRQPWLAAAALTTGFVLLYLAWKPFDFLPGNGCQWIGLEPGLEFEQPGIAYTDRSFGGGNGESTGRPRVPPIVGLRIRFRAADLRPETGVVVSVANPTLGSELWVEREGTLVLLRNRQGGTIMRRTDPRLVLERSASLDEHEVRVEWTGRQWRASFDDNPAVEWNDGPPGPLHGRLVLGAAPDGTWGFTGQVLELTARTSETAAAGEREHVRFEFGEGRGERAESVSGGRPEFIIPAVWRPARLSVLQKLDWAEVRAPWFLPDVLANLAAFLPLGALVTGALVGRRPPGAMWAALAMGLIVAFSLILELGQVLLPTRTSSLRDLLCNSIGGAAGVACWHFIATSARTISTGTRS